MPDINSPMDVPELNLQPPITGKIRLSEDMQQTLALLCGQGNAQRVLLKASAEGILLVGEPVIKGVIGVTGSGSPSRAIGTNIPCSQVLIMGHPDNTDTAWVRPYAIVEDGHGWPLEAWDVISFAVDNLNRLHFLFDTAAEKVIISYTR